LVLCETRKAVSGLADVSFWGEEVAISHSQLCEGVGGRPPARVPAGALAAAGKAGVVQCLTPGPSPPRCALKADIVAFARLLQKSHDHDEEPAQGKKCVYAYRGGQQRPMPCMQGKEPKTRRYSACQRDDRKRKRWRNPLGQSAQQDEGHRHDRRNSMNDD
jgi:hypothetical protein